MERVAAVQILKHCLKIAQKVDEDNFRRRIVFKHDLASRITTDNIFLKEHLNDGSLL